MRSLVISIAVLLAASAAWAQNLADEPGAKPTPEETTQQLTCPVDHYTFSWPAAPTSNADGGTDSDYCRYSGGGDAVLLAVVMCPQCNYAAALSRFAMPLAPDKRTAVFKLTLASPWRDVTDPANEVPAYERAKIALECANAVGAPLDMRIGYVENAVWSARIEAVRPVIFAYPMDRPQTLRATINGIRRKINEADNAEERNRLKLHLAMVYHRGGLVSERDQVLAELEPVAKQDKALASRIETFRKLNAIEMGFQRKLVALLDEKLAAPDVNDDERELWTYLKGDTLRRLGRIDDAIAALRSARRLMRQPSFLRDWDDYLLTMLAPGEPLPQAGVAEKPIAPTTPTTPTAPAPELPPLPDLPSPPSP